MITEAELKALGFHKIVGKTTMTTEYWLPLIGPTDNRLVEIESLSVKFNELDDEQRPLVYLGLRSTSILLYHIEEIDQLTRLYELLTGRSVEGVGRWLTIDCR